MPTLVRALKQHWDWLILVAITLATRFYLLRVYDVELSQDGFDAIALIATLQTQGIGALSNEQVTRLVLHPLYSLLLYALRVFTPDAFDFYLVARLFSTLIACVAVVWLFEFTRCAFRRVAAWIAALFLIFAPTFLWESISILSSTTFLALYIATLFALLQSHYRLAACFAFLAAITRLEGVVLVALVWLFLGWRDLRARKIQRTDWAVCVAFALAVPLTILGSSWLATGNPLAFIGAQSFATIWLRFLAPEDFFQRAAFFFTRYSAVIPAAPLGIAGAIFALLWYRERVTGLLVLTTALYVLFFVMLVWLNYTTLELRFLMYPGLPLLVFAAFALAWLFGEIWRLSKVFGWATLLLVVVAACYFGYRDGNKGMQFVYNSQSSMREMAEELARLIPPNQPTNVLAYGGTAGALDFFARQRGIELSFTEFRYAPDDDPAQYIVAHKIQFVIYPVGNAFAKAKYPYLARFETQTRGAVTFTPLTQFATSTDNQMYSIWSVAY